MLIATVNILMSAHVGFRFPNDARVDLKYLPQMIATLASTFVQIKMLV